MCQNGSSQQTSLLSTDTEAYKTSNDSYLSARESDYTPAAIFQPKDASEVANFLRIAKANNVRFAIRGAGQQPLEACANIQGGIVLCLKVQAYPRSLLRKTAELGGNVLGLDDYPRAEEEPLVTVLLLTYWKHRKDDEQILAVLQETLETIEKDTEARGQRVPYTYLNYASKFQDPFASYGEANKRSLQEISRKYDSDRLSQRNVPGGFRLF